MATAEEHEKRHDELFLLLLVLRNHWVNGNFRILNWRYCTIYFLGIFPEI
jgi:hypothetical protein